MDFSTDSAPVPCHTVTRNVHVTGGSQEQADALRDMAELIGVAIQPPDKDQDTHLGFLAPLVDALAKRGHGIFEARTEI